MVAAAFAVISNVALKETGQARQDLSEANTRISARVEELQVLQSRFLADRANQASGDGDAATAMLLALEALPDTRSGKQRPRVAEAEAALFKAYRALRESVVLKDHTGPLRSASFAPDGRGC